MSSWSINIQQYNLDILDGKHLKPTKIDLKTFLINNKKNYRVIFIQPSNSTLGKLPISLRILKNVGGPPQLSIWGYQILRHPS